MPEQQQNKQSQEAEKPKENDDQALFDIFVAQGIKIAGGIANELRGKASVDTLGNALFNIVNKIETEGQTHGIKFPLGVLFNGVGEILRHLVDVSDAKVNEEQVKAIIGIAVGRWLQNNIKTGRMSQQDVIALAEDAQQYQQQQAQKQPDNHGEHEAQPQQAGLLGGQR
jgi:ribosomal protein L12E/L44/L45/RPP1/RPP2